jgi:hypothetical protein
MKSSVSTFVLPTGVAASQRAIAAAPTNQTQRRVCFKKSYLAMLLVLTAPFRSYATSTPSEAPYCIAVGGGFGNGGSTFVARNYTQPSEGKCSQWTGYTKTLDTVILTTSGTSCLSSDSKALTVSVTSADPWLIGSGNTVGDYIQMNRTSSTDPFSGQDTGYLAGTAEPTTCTSDLLTLPSIHD